MEYISDSYLILFILVIVAFVAGFIDSIAGGGGFILLPALILSGLPPQTAIGTNKLPACLGTLTASINFIRNKKVIWSVALTGSIFAILGGITGSSININIPKEIINKLVIIILPFAFFLILMPKKQLKTVSSELSFAEKVFVVPIITFCLGVYDGFLGPGMGTFLIITFYSIIGLNMVNASAVAKIINLSSNAGALIVYGLSGSIIYEIGLTLAVSSILGNYLGSRLAIQKGERIVRTLLIFVVCLMIISLFTFKK